MQLLSLREVMAKTSLRRSSIYLLMAQNQFPVSVKLTPGRVAWASDEIDHWIAERIDERNEAGAA